MSATSPSAVDATPASARALKALSPSVRRLYKDHGPRCDFLDHEIETLSDYFDTVQHHSIGAERCWFRGHADLRWSLTPSALRYKRKVQRERALEIFRDFRQWGHSEMDPTHGAADEIEWMQRAQHYGLPTRLLDWSENAAMALFFACAHPDVDGLVFVVNPYALNRQQYPLHPRPIHPSDKAAIVEPYASLGPDIDPHGLGTIAISPIWNSKRLKAQQGHFTLHGSRKFCLDAKQAPSLMYVPIRKRHKRRLLSELSANNIHVMSMFPEPEYVGKFLKARAHLW